MAPSIFDTDADVHLSAHDNTYPSQSNEEQDTTDTDYTQWAGSMH